MAHFWGSVLSQGTARSLGSVFSNYSARS
jgi:hypothetical protein